MSELERQVVVERLLTRVDPSLRDELERLLEQETKRPPSVTHVGGVFGCADERGLNVLVATRPDGSGVLRVNDLAPTSRGLRRAAILLAIFAILSAAAGLAMALALTASITFAAFAVALFVGASLDRHRRRRRVRRIADASESWLARPRVELHEEEGSEGSEPSEAEVEPAHPGARERSA